MRIRRLSVGKLPNRPSARPQRGGSRAHDALPTTTEQDGLQAPTNNSPLHRESLHPALRYSKYSSSRIVFPRTLVSLLRVDSGSFKIYAEQASPLEVRPSLIRLMRDARPSSTSRGLQPILNQMYHLAKTPYQLSKSVRDVQFQIHSFASRLTKLTVLGHSISPIERQWNMTCHLSHQPGSPGVTSKPLIALSTQTLNLHRCIRAKWLHGFAEIRLLFHLRPDQLDSQDDSTPRIRDISTSGNDSAIQKIIDDINVHAIRSIHGRKLTTVGSVHSALKNGIISYLKCSPLTAIADLHHLQIAIRCGIPRTPQKPLHHFISQTPLALDGSERRPTRLINDGYSAPSDSTAKQEASVEPVVFQREESFVNYGADRATDVLHPLSHGVSERSGISEIKINVKELLTNNDNSASSGSVDVFSEFESICQSINERGIACCIAAAAVFSSRHPKITGSLISNDIDLKLERPRSGGRRHDRAYLSININRYDEDGDLSIHLRWSSEVACSVRTPIERTCHLRDFDIQLEANLIPTQVVSLGGSRISSSEEAGVLLQMTRTVVDQLCQQMTFESSEAIPQQLAEGILRTLRFASPTVSLQGVKVSVSLSEISASESTPLAAETWKESHLRPVRPTVRNKVMRKASNGEQSIVVGTVESNQRYGRDPSIVESLPSQVVSESPEAELLNEVAVHVDGEGVPSGRPGPVLVTKGVRLISSPRLSSAITKDKTGFDQFGFGILWIRQYFSEVSYCTVDFVYKMITSAIETSDVTGVALISHVFDKMTQLLPYTPHIELRFRRIPPHDHAEDLWPHIKGHIFFSIQNRENAPHEEHNQANTIKLQLPALLRFPIGLRNVVREDEGRCKVNIDLEGMEAIPEDRPATTKIKDPALSLLHTVSATALSTVKGRIFESLHHCGREIGSRLASNDEVIGKLLTLRTVLVRVRLDNEAGDRTIEGVTVATKVHRSPQQRETVDAESVHDEYNSQATVLKNKTHTEGVFIALGSNVGDRFANIEAACREIDAEPDIRIVRSSPLYETEPMYVEDQGRFLNGACEVRTALEPEQLLDKLQAIEQRLGRVKLVDKGPRNIDLDILLYKNDTVNTDRLKIPHPLMAEREFVLRPLCDIYTSDWHSYRVDGSRPRTTQSFLRKLPLQTRPIHPVIKLGDDHDDLRINDEARRTRLMSILNMTPDSFSDGGTNSEASAEDLKASISQQVANGATVLDIGGQSSRPNAPDITTEEEIARVMPVLEAIKSMPDASNVTISVDTYRAAVAEAAVKTGAHIINDISAGQLDPDMLSTVAKLGCTYIMMHMRGTPATMQSDDNCSYPEGVIPTVGRELSERVEAAQAAGIRRWRMILDPGIGFSKTQAQNLEILAKLAELRRYRRLQNMPWLVGSSRKGFIGKITGVKEPKDRSWGTAATVTAAIQGGADFVRVHDVDAMAKVVKMADAIYRK